MRVGVFHDNDVASVFYLVEFKRVFVFLGQFYVFVEESDVMFCKMFMFIIIFFLDQLLLELMCPDPGKKLHSEFSTLEDHVFKMDLNLLDNFLGVRLKIAKFRVLHNYNYIIALNFHRSFIVIITSEIQEFFSSFSAHYLSQ